MMNAETLNHIISNLKFSDSSEIFTWLRRKEAEYEEKLDLARNQLFDFVVENPSIDIDHSQDYNKLLRTVNNYSSALDQIEKMVEDLGYK